MTTEPTAPQPEMGPVPANGQGQSQGHRRRRRRRKNKSNQPGGQQPQQGQGQQSPPVQQAQPQMQAQQQQGGQQQKQGSGRHRKKKKFFQQKNGPQQPQPQPGNSIVPQHQGRRKDRQKGPRMFVGPMDHSYRAANGNVADAPPSTIPTSGNGHHSSNYYDVNVGSPSVAVRADAPTRIFCFIDDLFFQAKIQETAKKLGVKVEFVKGEKDTVSRITDATEPPTLLVFDLNNLNAKPMTLIPKFKTKFKKATSIIGFLNHLQGDLKLKAIEAGCDTVMPRSAFSQSLPNLLRRYGLEEEDEYVPQPAF
ncbi:response regulator [Occallatibacter savannae]|uniref:response regulator n=1 Tax=Occallatibacter savannae TaxID=1002691 RepID=UPI000D6963F9|nr:response regulator [Occallatibacter savannae]